MSNRVAAGVAALPGKWWSVPQESGAVGNLLTASTWSRGGQPAYNQTYVEVRAAPGPVAVEFSEIAPVTPAPV